MLQDGEKKSILTGMVKATHALLLAGAANSSAPLTAVHHSLWSVLVCAGVFSGLVHLNTLLSGLVAGSCVRMFECPNPH